MALKPACGEAFAAFPAGTYWTRIAASEIDDPRLKVNAGLWQIVYEANRTFRVYKDRQLLARGSYTIAGNRIVLSDNSFVCRGLGNGTYEWRAGETSLALELVQDRCSHRGLVMPLHVWKRQ